MASHIVLDSGVLLATVLVEPFSNAARTLIGELIKSGLEISVPTLFLYEIVAVLRKNTNRGLLTATDAVKYRDVLLAQPVQPIIDHGLLRRAHELAESLNRPSAYDAQYLALAERLNCDFWTADEKLFNAVSGHLGWVKWLGNFPAEQVTENEL